MTALLEILQNPGTFLETLIILLLGLLFFKENLMRWINKKMGIADAPGTLSRLANYYNHDLTDKLTSIDTSLKSISEGIRDQHLNNGDVRDLVKDTNTLLRELKEYGVKCR